MDGKEWANPDDSGAAVMERWPGESNEDYANRINTQRQVDAARARYEQSDEYRAAQARASAYNGGVSTMPQQDFDDEDMSLGGRLNALAAGMTENTATLRAGLGLDTTQEARDWAERKLQESDPFAEREQELLGQFGAGTKNTVARLQAARAKLAAQQPDKRDFWLAMAQGAAMPNEGGKLGWTGNVAAAVRPALAAQRKLTDDQQAGLDEYDTAIEGAQRGETDLQLRMLMERRKAWDAERLRAAQILGKNVPGAGGGAAGGPRRFGQETASGTYDWLTKNGPVFERSMIELQGALDMMEQAQSEGKKVSGRNVPSAYLSLFGDFGEKMESIANPLASEIRNRVLNTVQQTLRPTLGAQFTEREGQRVLARAYDPLKPPQVNIARIKSLLTQIQKQAAASRSISDWFLANNGDMSGYVMPADEAAAFEAGLYAAMDDAERALGLNRAPGQRPGVITIPPKPEPKPGDIISIDDSKRKPRRSFMDRVWPFAEGGAVGYAQGGYNGIDDEPIEVLAPDGRILTFAPGTTIEQMREWYAAEQRKEQRKETLLDLGAAGAAGVGGAGAGWTGMRALEGAVERMPFSPLRISPGERRGVDKANAESIDLSDAGRRLEELQRKHGIPAVGLDVMPTEMRGLVNEAMRTGTPATRELQSTLGGRNMDARGNRIPAAIDTATKADPYLEQRGKLEEARKTAADPLYEAMRGDPLVKANAFDTIPTKTGGEQNFIDWMSTTKPGAEAIERANVKWTTDKTNAGKSPVRVNATGLPVGYDITYLDNIKQALDDIEADATGKGYSAGDVAKIRRRFLEQIDAARPDYSKARSAFGEGSRPLTALSIGRGGEDIRDLSYQDVDGRMVRAKGFLDMSPEEAQRYLRGIGAGEEMENLRTGVAEALNREMQGPAGAGKEGGVNPAQKILNNLDRMANLEMMLDPKDFNRLRATLEAEAAAWDTSSEFGRKTESARGKARGAPVSTTTKVTKGAKGAPGMTIRALNPFSWMYRLTVPERPIPADVTANEDVRLFKPNEADDIVRSFGLTRRKEELDRLAKAAGRRATRGRRAGRAGLLGGLAAAAGTLYSNFADDDEEERP